MFTEKANCSKTTNKRWKSFFKTKKLKERANCATFPSVIGLLTFYFTSFSHAYKERNLRCYLEKDIITYLISFLIHQWKKLRSRQVKGLA